MQVAPITFKAACEFVRMLHRHNKPPRGHKFSVSLVEGGKIVGVEMAGRPVARHYDDGLTLEINRTCTDGCKNANSMLYGACRRAAWALGYRRSWAESSVKLKAVRDPVGNGGVDRVLWGIMRSEAESKIR